jgi:hypothetical protein
MVDMIMTDITEEDNYDKLVNIIAQSPSREWADKYLQWMEKPLESKGIYSSANECFKITLTSGSPSKQYAGITLLGSRIRCIKIIPPDQGVDVIVAGRIEKLEKETINSPDRDADYPGTHDGRKYYLNAPLDGFVLSEFEDEWLELTDIELSGKGTVSIGTHNRAAYRAITDEEDRKRVLADAF